eukprot:1478360-Alexandrium_andersonii.AAC.1
MAPWALARTLVVWRTTRLTVPRSPTTRPRMRRWASPRPRRRPPRCRRTAGWGPSRRTGAPFCQAPSPCLLRLSRGSSVNSRP